VKAAQHSAVRNSSVSSVKNDGNIMRGSSERHQRSGVKNEPCSFMVHLTLGSLKESKDKKRNE